MSLNNKLNLARAHTVFAVKETTKGTLVFPAAANLVVPAGYATANQQPTFTDSEEIIDSRSLIEQFTDRKPAGQWALPMYMRISGTAGAVPQGDALFECLFGSKAIVGGTSVTYSLAKALPSFSLWMKYDDMVLFAKGATVNQVTGSVGTKGAIMFNFSGGFMDLGWVGTDELAEAVDGTPTPDTSVVVKDSKKYKAGGKIKVGTNDNSGTGYLITAVNYATHTLTVSPGVNTDEAINTVVAPFLPTGTKIGTPAESRTNTVSFDGGSTVAKIKGFDFTFTNNIQYQEDEISGDDYPIDYVEDRRSVSGTVTILLRRDDVKYFYDGYNNTNIDMQIGMGDTATAGDGAKLNLDKVRLQVPNLNPTSPTIELPIQFTSLGTNGEDEIALVLA